MRNLERVLFQKLRIDKAAYRLFHTVSEQLRDDGGLNALRRLSKWVTPWVSALLTMAPDATRFVTTVRCSFCASI
jgi:hypothetical protein